MRAATNQLIELTRRNPQITRDPLEILAIHLPDLAELAPMLEPLGERIDQELNPGIWLALRDHDIPSD
jgi:hypothetical protein